MQKEAILFIMFSLLFSNLALVYALRGEQGGGGEVQGGVREEIPTEQRIIDTLDTSINGDGTVDFENPLFKNNIEIVKKVLREKYNLNINNFVGGKITGGVLQLPGGTSINLKTGKTVTIDAAGATINTFSDGKTVYQCLNFSLKYLRL